MTREKLFQIGVKALIRNKSGQILVMNSGDWHLKDQEPHWDIPGGRIQEGETMADALAREVEEETGLKEIASNELFTAVMANFKDIDIDAHKVGLALFIFNVEVPEGSKITLSEEHSHYEWVKPAEAAKRLAYKYPPEFTQRLAEPN